MIVIDIKSDLPTVLDAGRRLAEAIRKYKTERVIKVIHGYGSTGIGGKIKVSTHKSLRKKVSAGEIKAFIPGEGKYKLSSYAGEMAIYGHLVIGDNDFKNANDGITFIIIKG